MVRIGLDLLSWPALGMAASSMPAPLCLCGCLDIGGSRAQPADRRGIVATSMFLLGTGKARWAFDIVLHALSWLASKHAKVLCQGEILRPMPRSMPVGYALLTLLTPRGIAERRLRGHHYG
ncbi:hypothetical protein BJX66DRAFT_307406 [Aspergillus keveii]|uniref:Uncharacterized protein n=1 Tax=Aspergillus keveii TaxID=714993 RepID=A0ABR4G0W9_9EURO